MSTFNLTGTGFHAGDTIEFDWDSPATVLATVAVRTDGTIGPVQASVPAGSATGAHTISAKKAGIVVDTVGFTVDAPPAATLTCAPTHGLAGSGITLAGTNWPVSTSIQVVFDNPTVVIATIMTDGSGAFSGEAATVPAGASAGTHSMAGRVGSSGSYLANCLYTVDSPAAAILTVTPASGSPGTNVHYVGSNFTPNSTVTITDDVSSYSVVIVADANGHFDSPNRTGPPLPVGVHTLTANDNGSPVRSDAATFDVLAAAAVSVTPTTGAPGTNCHFVGSGFTPNSTVTLTDGSSSWSIVVTANGSGAFDSPNRTGPPAPVGTHTLTARDNGSPQRSASCTFTVTGTVALTVTPTTIGVGGQVSYHGTGFHPGSFTRIHSNLDSGFEVSATPDSAGAFTFTARVPTVAGHHVLTATDNSSPAASASCTLDVTQQATLSVSPASGPQGIQLDFAGSGYTPNSTVRILDNMDSSFLLSGPVASDGRFSHAQNSPAGPPGTHTFTGTDNGP